ncbi:MAG: ATP-dependent helicase, partial [Chlorobiales bacterium]|nr:ATP-dependent helicase [Chlorobiales bacterium]
MTNVLVANPAEVAAQRALDQMFLCIRERKSFRLEAGAGSGKTYSLVKALQLIIDEEGAHLVRRHQRVACITYTNVATDEVTRRTDGHPAVQASTIHSFCWELCKSFQAVLRSEVMNIPELVEKINEVGEIGARRIGYDLGHRRVTDTEILLHHDDVLKLMVALMERSKFRRIFAARYPVLFIDEYQDTDAAFAESLIRYFVEPKKGPLVGLFGDSWQKIYRTGAGLIDHASLQLIGKEANFRSVPDVVSILNRIRPDLPQQVSDPAAVGSAKVYHSNGFMGQRQSGGHWSGDLPA